MSIHKNGVKFKVMDIHKSSKKSSPPPSSKFLSKKIFLRVKIDYMIKEFILQKNIKNIFCSV